MIKINNNQIINTPYYYIFLYMQCICFILHTVGPRGPTVYYLKNENNNDYAIHY